MTKGLYKIVPAVLLALSMLASSAVLLSSFAAGPTTLEWHPTYPSGGTGNSGGSSGCPYVASYDTYTGELWTYVNVGSGCTTYSWAFFDMSFTAAYGVSNGKVDIAYNNQDVDVYNNGCGNVDLELVVAFYQGSSQIQRAVVRTWYSVSSFSNGNSNFTSQINVNLVQGTTYHMHVFYEGYGSPCYFFYSQVEGQGLSRDYVYANGNSYDAAYIVVQSISWTY